MKRSVVTVPAYVPHNGHLVVFDGNVLNHEVRAEDWSPYCIAGTGGVAFDEEVTV